MAKDEWVEPVWSEVGDIMRPYDASDDARQPEGGPPAAADGNRKRRRPRAGLRRRGQPGLTLLRKPKLEEISKKRQRAAFARAYRLRVAAQIVPWAVILLLAPFIGGPGGFYPLALLLAAPAAAAALLLRPLGRRAWMLRALIPLLPVEAWFALRYFAWNPGGALGLLSLFALAGSLYYISGLRGKGSGKEPGPGRRQARRARGGDDKQAEKGRRRRFLLLAVPLLCAALLLPALMGLATQLRRPAPNAPTELEAQSRADDVLMARRMNGAYGNLRPEAWAQMDRGEKLKALQALLDVETDRQDIRRFDLRDPTVLAAAGGGGHTGVSAALLSGKAKAELRVRAMCHLAYHLMQLTLSGDVNMSRFEDEAKAFEDARYAAYANTWDNREAEIDHAG
ncbi:MAG: hypothetical protein LBB75_08205 [Oscillospiraceae bacterium]|jgi:hypothetical protein|nr:hypothetical protein [Oscillospiraceae bacterium]